MLCVYSILLGMNEVHSVCSSHLDVCVYSSSGCVYCEGHWGVFSPL